MQAQSILLWSSSTWPLFFHHFTLNSVYRFLSNLHPSTICFGSFCLFFFFFFLSAKLGGLRACRLTPPHLMRLLVIVLSNIRLYSLQTIHCFFQEMCYWTALHAGHVRFFFLLLFFLSVLEDVLFVGWLQHGIHTSFMASSLFWDSNKKVTGLPTPRNLYKCISAVLKCTTTGCH